MAGPNEPSWVVEPTTEWHPQFPGQRYAGDIGVAATAAAARTATVVGRAEVPPLAPTRPDGTYLGRSWSDEPPAEQAPHGRSGADDEPAGRTPAYGRLARRRAPAEPPPAAGPTAPPPHYDHEPYRRPLPEPPRARDRRPPSRTGVPPGPTDAQRRAGPAREAAWHRDQPTPERYDSRRPGRADRDIRLPARRRSPRAPDRTAAGCPSPMRRRADVTLGRQAADYDRHTPDGYAAPPSRDHGLPMAWHRRTRPDPWAPVDGRTGDTAPDGYPDRAAHDLRRPESDLRRPESALPRGRG